MAESSNLSTDQAQGPSQPKVIETIVEAAKQAFDPSLDATARELRVKEYDETLARTETWVLIHALNTLIKPDVLPVWLRQPLLKALTLLPLRPDGVRSTLEFVFSVHPSSGNTTAADAAQPQKGGAGITHEAVAVATKLLSSVPSSMTADEWFQGLSGQLFSLFDGEAGPDLAKTAAQIVGFGILGKRQFGAPGSPGWNVFVQPLLRNINPSLEPPRSKNDKEEPEPEIEEMRQQRVLVSAQSLETAIRRLQTLILSNPSPGLCRRVLRPVIIQLWSLSSWTGVSPHTERHVCTAARNLVQTYLRLFGDLESMKPLIQKVTCTGSTIESEVRWTYHLDDDGRLDVTLPREPSSRAEELDLALIEQKTTSLVNTVTGACSSEEVSALFLYLLRRWIETSQKQGVTGIQIKPQEQNDRIPIEELVEVSLLQTLMDKAPEKLVSHFDQLLDIISQVLTADARSPLGDDLIAVVLSLLNLVITAPSFQKSDIGADELRIIEEALDRIGGRDQPDTSSTARNLAMLLKYRDEIEDPDDAKPRPTTRQIEDRKTYSLAMNYITGDSNNPPPVVSEGLNMLSNLIVAESPILDITAVTVLMSNLLKENEDYINLRVVKVFTQLANKHPKSTVREILDNYLDPQEKASTDIRLRFGEALAQVIERLGQTFSGEIAQQTCEALLSIAGRRGYRPKTMAKQERDEKLQKMKQQKATEDTGQDVDMDQDEELTEEEKAGNAILAQIVQGWDSKRGSEDIRMRASSLSIFGAALETNIGGIGPTIVSNGVDLCVNILRLERELEAGILRRAAIVVMLNFVKALDDAKESGKSLGFGLTDDSRRDIHTTLEYVAHTDNDGLVQQHARDVAEILENWGIGSLLPNPSETAAPGLTQLAGLRVTADGDLVDASGRPRPRIEEVE
ncbi:protein required for cell viability [Purpureocillium lavendulum]|uniref:Protein required for cell viability n=1 Tax=Purpureocillium lavendulum TaxID=1247861 RepID=A0AB34FRV0_9HYPO|nr:protein required for cell viability [Purpureocillium lavendulum]